MSYVKIKDFGWRLGNQMFQVAAAYDYSINNNIKLLIDTNFKLLEKNIEYDYLVRNSQYNLKHINNDNLEYYSDKNYVPENTFEVELVQGGFDYKQLYSIEYLKEIVPSNQHELSIGLIGYFQSYKYFEEKRTQKFFNLDSIVESAKLSKASNPKSCSVHIRRGDYLNFPEHHPVLDIEYYREAMHKIGKDHAFYVCSDDLKYATTEFYDTLHEEFHIIHCRYSEVKDLALMSTCRNNIIANSSFSWWAAYLNQNPSKVVIAPNTNQRWFGKALKNYNMNDLLPESWIQI